MHRCLVFDFVQDKEHLMKQNRRKKDKIQLNRKHSSQNTSDPKLLKMINKCNILINMQNNYFLLWCFMNCCVVCNGLFSLFYCCVLWHTVVFFPILCWHFRATTLVRYWTDGARERTAEEPLTSLSGNKLLLRSCKIKLQLLRV